MIVKKRLASSLSWTYSLVIFQGYHEVSSLHLLFASHWCSQTVIGSKWGPRLCLIDLDSRIWEPFCSASLRFLSVSASVSPRRRCCHNGVSLQIQSAGRAQRNSPAAVAWKKCTFHSAVAKLSCRLWSRQSRSMHAVHVEDIWWDWMNERDVDLRLWIC